MKQRLLLKWTNLFAVVVMVLGLSTNIFAANIPIGSGGTGTTSSMPINSNWGYNYTQQIVLASEFTASGAAGNITAIRFSVSGVPSSNLDRFKDWDVYIGHTTKTEFASLTDWEVIGNLTQVFSDTIAPVAGSWMELTFSTPFNYDGTSNLIVAVHEKTPNYQYGFNVHRYVASANRALQYRNDSNNPDPANPPTASSRATSLAQIQFEGVAASCPSPSVQGTTNVMATTADLYWTTGGASNWVVEYGPTGFTQGTGTTVSATNDTLNITGLTAETTYEWYVRDFCGGTDSSAWVGANSFTTPPTCPAPTSFTLSGATLSSATLSWVAGGTETSWEIEYGTTGFTQGSGTIVTVSTDTFTTLSGLAANTDYQAYLRATCSPTDSSAWTSAISFRTGYCIPSSSNTSTYVDSFSTTGGTQNISNLSSGYTTGGYLDSTALIVESYAGGSFDFNSIIVGGSAGFSIWIDWNNDLVFDNATEKVFNTTSYGNGPFTGTISVPMGTALGNYRMRISTDYNSYNPSIPCASRTRAEFEDYTVSVVAPPPCVAPTALTASNITATSAHLAWTAVGTETTWNVEWDTTGFTQGAGTMVSGTTTNPHALSGLTAQTSYDFYVQASCGGSTSTWAGPFTFTTPCATVTAPYTEGFENGGTIPNCWTNSGAENWRFSNAPGSNDHIGNNGTITGATATGGYFAWVDASGSHANAVLTSPLVDLTSLTTPALTFYELSHNEGHANSQLLVEVYDGANWNTVGTYNTNTAGWELKVIDLSGLTFTGAAQVRFTFTEPISSDYYDDIAIDDVSFVEMPTCFQPSVLTVSNITVTSADLGWTAGATETAWNVEYGAAGFTQGSGTMVATTTNPHSLTGLTANTSYDFYVQADCGGSDTSTWAGPITFTTLCNPFTAPYTQNFDGTTAPTLDDCWTGVSEIGTNTYANVQTSTIQANSVSNSVRLYNSSVTSGKLLLVTPNFSDLDNTKRIRFMLYDNNHASDLIIGTMSNPADTATFTPFDTIAVADMTVNTWTQHIVNFDTYTGTDKYIAFSHGLNTTYDNLYIDDFNYEVIPTCELPTALTTSNLTSTSVDLGWTAGGSETEWQIEYGTTGFTQGTGTFVVTTTNPHSISGLTAETTYDFYVRGICAAGDTSAWSGSRSFYTGYCVPSSSGSGTYVDNFTTTGGTQNISNTSSGFSAGGYVNNSATLFVESSAGASFDFNATIVGGSAGFSIWIDWNNDLVFDNATEKVFNTSGYGNGPFTGTITVPAGTALGDYRMRITTDYWLSNPSLPCDNRGRAEFEDYKVSIVPCTPPTGTDVRAECSSYTWIDGNTYTTNNNTATHTITGGAANGCDSIVTLDLTINMPTTGTDVIDTCGTSFTWIDGNTYSANNNTATHTLTNAVNCDSVVTLNLTLRAPSTHTVSYTGCQGDGYSVIVGSTTYNESNPTGIETLTNAVNCDSVVTVNLVFNAPSTHTVSYTGCQGDGYSVVVGSTTYNESNPTGTETLTNAVSCDSVVTVNLVFNTPSTGTDIIDTCGTSFTWIDGNTYSANNNTATHTLTNAANCDSVVTLNLTLRAPATSTDTRVACGSFTWIDGNTYTASNNTATHTIAGGAANTCDSVVTLDLTITTPVTYTVSVAEPTLSVSPAADAYQWINCADNSAIAGATAQSYTATANGSYQVVVTNGACTDTLAPCKSITSIGIETTDFGILSIYPNPAKDKLNVEFEDNATEASTVSIINVLGQQVFVKENISDKTLEINTTEFTDGVYYISIMSESRKVTQSFVIEK